ncbi:hypothetical protein RHGRI_006060 [Rhododendron griersonianum]|uniref:Ubiquitin-like protease family profile domain-containing protein n=1 Tax=Rhododendron griersonianum TaxID=479676 RepID=A0AAV6LEG1_9ERIC|nr:hypothetical protein RHGRI_006060 [Rhododendron griersonianum]
MDGSRMSGLLFAQQMPLYSPEAEMADVVQHAQHVNVQQKTVVGKDGDEQGQEEDDEEDEEAEDEEEEEEEEEEQQQQEEEEHDDDDDGEGEGEVQKEDKVTFTPPLNKGPRTRLQKRKSETRPSTKRGKRTVKASKARRTPYVAPPEVMATMIEQLMKEEKAKAPMKDGVPRPTQHMFSSVFVYNLLNFAKVQDQKVLDDAIDVNILGYDVAMCNLASFTLFLPVLLTDIEHWYCVVVNLVDKRIEVVDSMVLKTTDKKVATKTVVGMLFNVLSRTRTRRQLPTPWNEWHVYEPAVSQQDNTHDCGFYTLKFMEHWTGGRMNTRELEDHVGNDAMDLRKRLLVRLLLSSHNQLRDVVLTRFLKCTER